MRSQPRSSGARLPHRTRTARPPRAVEHLEPRTFLSAGDLDPWFGRVETDFPQLSQETARRAARQSDGRIVVLVTETAPGTRSLLARYTAAGKLDTTFGAAGSILLPFPVGTFALRPDDKIVVAGYGADNDPNGLVLARYTAGGQIDTTFGGGDGVLTTSFGNFAQAAPWTEPTNDSFDTADAVAVDSAGKITVAGRSYDPTDTDPTFLAIARYLPSGDLDPTFSPGGLEGSGKLWAYFGLAGQTHDLALLPGGRILVSGTVGGYDGPDFGLARLNADGSFDTTFGVAGQVQANPGGDNVAYDLLPLSDDRALLVGGALDSGDPSPTPPDGPVALISTLVGVRSPFAAAATPLPGTLEFENFDNGGEGVAYHDTDPINQGGAYRPNTAVDLQAIPTGGTALAFARAGEWTEYTVDVAQAGTYNLALLYASPKGGGRFHLEIDGKSITPSLTAASTGDWQKYRGLPLDNIAIPASRSTCCGWRWTPTTRPATSATSTGSG